MVNTCEEGIWVARGPRGRQTFHCLLFLTFWTFNPGKVIPLRKKKYMNSSENIRWEVKSVSHQSTQQKSIKAYNPWICKEKHQQRAWEVQYSALCLWVLQQCVDHHGCVPTGPGAPWRQSLNATHLCLWHHPRESQKTSGNNGWITVSAPLPLANSSSRSHPGLCFLRDPS